MVVFENITTDPHELPNDGQLGMRILLLFVAVVVVVAVVVCCCCIHACTWRVCLLCLLRVSNCISFHFSRFRVCSKNNAHKSKLYILYESVDVCLTK